jgi:sulfur relay (sulfurtransferase) DsrC/TusE family protein
MIKITDKLQYVCDTLAEIIQNEQEQKWLDSRITYLIEAQQDQDSIARELANEYGIELPKDRWNVWA